MRETLGNIVTKSSIILLPPESENSTTENDLNTSPSVSTQLPARPVTRGYSPWTSAQRSLKNEDYCRYIDLLVAFETIKNTDFNNSEKRAEAITILNNIKLEKLVERKKRFPAYISYVNLTNSIYADLLEKIIAALECENNCILQGQQIIKCSCKEIFTIRITWALRLQHSVRTEELPYYGVFKRETFEKWHALTWV